MKTELKRAIKFLSEKINSVASADEALKYTQAALNLTHVWAQLEIHNPEASQDKS